MRGWLVADPVIEAIARLDSTLAVMQPIDLQGWSSSFKVSYLCLSYPDFNNTYSFSETDVFTGVKGGIVRFAGQRQLPETLKLAAMRQSPSLKAFAATMVPHILKQQLDLIVQSYLIQPK